MNNAAIVHGQARLGDIDAHQHRAIELLTRAQGVWTRDANPREWAVTRNNLGAAWLFMPNGDRAENVGRAIEAYKQALEVRTREAHPVDWAATQNNLGLAYVLRSEIGGSRADLVLAIASVRAAAGVFTESDFPFDHQTTIAPALEELRTLWLGGGHGSEADLDAIPAAE